MMDATWWTQPDQLDAQQKRVVALPLKGDHLIIGPPGSGKTNLLVLRATFLDQSKVYNTAILTFGRVLREFLAAGTSNYPFSESKVQTYVRWGTQILSEHGIRIDKDANFENMRSLIRQHLAEIVKSGKAEKSFDCILIDEAQDYSAEEISLIQNFTKQIFAVGDDQQRIYETDGALQALGDFCTTSKLLYHYRNGIQVCRVADGLRDKVDSADGLEATSQYDEAAFPSSARAIGKMTIAKQVSAAVEEIKTQLRAYPGSIIGVLCPRHEELGEVCDLMERSSIAKLCSFQRFADGYTPFEGEKPVIVTTLHGAKGLEFRAVHILGTDYIGRFRGVQKRMCFTGITRCKTSLLIYHEKELPGYLQRGIGGTGPEGDPPLLKDLFLG